MEFNSEIFHAVEAIVSPFLSTNLTSTLEIPFRIVSHNAITLMAQYVRQCRNRLCSPYLRQCRSLDAIYVSALCMEGYFTQSSSSTGTMYLFCPLLWRVYIKLSSNFGLVVEHQYLCIYLRSPTLERTSIRKLQ